MALISLIIHNLGNFTSYSVFSVNRKAENLKKWKTYCFGPETSTAVRPSPLKKLHDAMKAWAKKHFAHLGQFWPKSLRAVHLRWTVTRGSHSDKTGEQLIPQNPNVISHLPRLCSHPNERARWWPAHRPARAAVSSRVCSPGGDALPRVSTPSSSGRVAAP
jgi:hypothetical protein